MKNRKSFQLVSLLLVSLSTSASAQLLDVEGSATPLARLTATSLSFDNDILEIIGPAAPVGLNIIPDGQFIECQAGTEVRAYVDWSGAAYFKNKVTVGTTLEMDNTGLNNSAQIAMHDEDGNQTVIIHAKDGSTATGGDIIFYGGSPLAETIEIDGNWSGSGKGRIVTDELQITAGADIAENFDLSSTSEDIDAGMLVSIDPQETGKLSLTTQAYDTRVAGVISGANGVNTGLFMGQRGNEKADGAWPVALAGRVYVKADASFGAIRPGDLLTSSPTPGHAMKVKSRRKAEGAIIGKAMSSLEEGKDFVLVLISLQ